MVYVPSCDMQRPVGGELNYKYMTMTHLLLHLSKNHHNRCKAPPKNVAQQTCPLQEQEQKKKKHICMHEQ